MKVVLLAGGLGTRISEESEYRPKPMTELGGMPILWHIMKEYSYYGYTDFIICAGYKQHMIKKWFADYCFYVSDISFDFTEKKHRSRMIVHNYHSDPWRVTVVDTGLYTQTGGRIKRVQDYIGNEPFMMTYGDGLCDVNINDIVSFHNKHKTIATLTSVKQKQQKGVLEVGMDNTVHAFREKSTEDGALINAGYMVFEPEIFNYITDDNSVLETDVLSRLADEGQLKSYLHTGFWQCMDTLLEKKILEKMLADNKAPWKMWD